MPRIVLCVAVIAIMLVVVSSTSAQTPEITDGLAYLTAIQNAEGSWGTEATSTDILPATVSVMEAMQVLGETSAQSYADAVRWLRGQALETTDHLSERIHALSAAGTDLEELLSYRDEKYTGAWGGHEGYEANNLDTALALEALRAVEYDDLETIGYTLGYLTRTQNEDGGWGFSEGDESNVYMTALVSMTLQQFTQTISLATAINRATDYLIAHQNSDGGFGSSESTVYETAFAYIALVGVTTDATVLGRAVEYIAGMQSDNGSWDDDPYSTALAIRVLYLSENKPPPPLEPTTGTVTGKVVDATTSQPLIGVSVVLQSDAGINTQTDTTGDFTLSEIPEGSRTIGFSLSGYGPASVTVDITAGSILDIGTILLYTNPTTGIIKGTVTDADSSRPLEGVTIEVTGSFSGSTITGTDGSFIITGVTPGSVTISASRDGYNVVTGTGTVAAGGILLFSPRLNTISESTSGTVTGRVVDAVTDQPLSGVSVVLQSDTSINTLTDGTGKFTLADIEAGDRQISFSLTGYATSTVTVNIPGGAIVDLGAIALSTNPTTGIIKGTVNDTEGQPLEGVILEVTGTFNGSTATDADGGFAFTDVPPGSVTIRASKTGYSSVTGTGEVVAGGIVFFNIEMGLSTGKLTGKVFDGTTKEPIEGAGITLSGGPSTSTDTQGVFLIGDITPDIYEVTITASGYVSQRYQVMINEGVTTDMQTIYLSQSHTSTTVKGKVTDAATGEAISGAEVMVAGTELSARTDPGGEYAISGITVLKFKMKASAAGYDSLIYEMETSDYGVFSVDFELTQSKVSNLIITDITTDKQSYQAHEDVMITAEIENLGSIEAEGVLMAEIEDGEGNVIALVPATEPRITLAPAESIQTEIHWNTGQFSPGRYFITVKVADTETGGAKYAERAAAISIIPTPEVGGAIALSPPVTQADMLTPVEIRAAIRNTGNVMISTVLRLEASFNGIVVYSTEVVVTGLRVNEVEEFELGSFIPQEGGEYAIRLKPADESVTADISATLYVGPHARVTFTVEPVETLPGDVDVMGKIKLKGIGVTTGSVQDPLVPLIKDAIQKGVDWEQPTALKWQKAKNCYGCHVQTQTLIGLELSRDKVVVDDDITRQLLEFMKSCQAPDGFETRRPGNTGDPQPVETTTLYAWSLSYYHDESQIQDSLARAVDYLITRQSASGYWISDYYYGTKDWWNDLGYRQPSTPFTAYNTIALVKAYQLSGAQKYKDSMLVAVGYLKNLDHRNSIITAAHIVIGLEAALPLIDDGGLKAGVETKIDMAIEYIKVNQNTDGGWGRYAGDASDPLPTAHVLYAMSLAGADGRDTALRDGTVYLLNEQNPDGTWSTILNRQPTYPDRHFAPTTWAIISLPVALESIAGVAADLVVTVPSNIDLNYSSIRPAKITPSEDSTAYLWAFRGVDEEGKELLLDLKLKALELGEEREVASEAYVSFKDTYTGGIVTVPVEIPSVRAIAPVAIDVTTDKEEYTAEEDISITTTIANISPEIRNPTVRIIIEDSGGNLVAEVAEFPVDDLKPSSTQTYTVTWNTGTTISGNFRVRAGLYEEGAFLTDDTAGFKILPEKVVSTRVSTDKISYSANEPVTITSTVQSLSRNYIFEDLSTRISITDMDGTELYTETNNIPILTPGQLTELRTYWNTAQNPPGQYNVTLEVKYNTEVLGTSTAAFEILGTSVTGEGLTGTITALPAVVCQGRDETLSWSITNSGNEDISRLDIRVLIVDPETKEIKKTISGEQPINRGETVTEVRTVSTADLGSGVYLVVLQASTPSMPEPRALASTTFEVRPGIEISKGIVDVTNLLVWVNDGCPEGCKEHGDEKDGVRIRLDLLDKIFREAVTSYLIVHDRKDFEAELSNPYYTDYLILGNHHPLEDGFREELKEKVYSGRGLVSSLYMKHGEQHGEDYDPVFGIRFKGYLPGDVHEVELVESAVSEAGVLDTEGKAAKVEADEETIVAGWMKEEGQGRSRKKKRGEDKKYPAIVINAYGEGGAVYYAFDLGVTVNDENFDQVAGLIRNSISYVHRPIDTEVFHPNQLIPVEIQIRSLGSAFDLMITERYPAELKLYDPVKGQWISDNPYVTEIHLEPDETKTILFYVLTPEDSGAYTLQTEAGYLDEGEYIFYRTIGLQIVVE